MSQHLTVIALLALVSLPVQAGDDSRRAMAQMQTRDGETLGTIWLAEKTDGVSLKGEIVGLSPGVRAIHIHETGKCEGDFSSAGGHFNPAGRQHGLLNEAGSHAGDLPNFVMPASGPGQVRAFAPGLRIHDGQHPLMDEDGAAIVIHADADDHHTDPAGAAGERIVCGVVINVEGSQSPMAETQ